MSKIYSDLEKAVSTPRLSRYLTACGQKKGKALTLYRLNIELSQEVFGVLSIFEVALRNALDQHYGTQFLAITGNREWLISQSSSMGFLCDPSLKNPRGRYESSELVQKAKRNLGVAYTHDKLVGELMFGFWRYMFAPKQFVAGGNTLLRIFSNKPKGKNYTDVFNELTKINHLRNRIAHHEPICFDAGALVISTIYVREHYQLITDQLTWLGYNPQTLLRGIDHVLRIANKIDTL